MNRIEKVREAVDEIILDMSDLEEHMGDVLSFRFEPYGRDGAYEYIRGIYDNLDRSVIDCSNS